MIFYLYVLIINIVGFATMGIDKWKAKNRKWRIPEKTLLLVAVIGGAAGSIIGMYTFRHKTKHALFYIGLPLILIIQIVLTKLLFSLY